MSEKILRGTMHKTRGQLVRSLTWQYGSLTKLWFYQHVGYKKTTIIFILGQQFSFIWANFIPLHLKMVCAEFEWSWSFKWFFVSVFLLFHHHIPSERTCTAFILNKRTSLCQGQAGRFRKIFLKVVYVFSLYVALIYSCSIIHVYSSKFDRDHRIISQIQIVL